MQRKLKIEAFKQLKILITGSEGFIGRNLSSRLLIGGIDVLSMDISISPTLDIRKIASFKHLKDYKIDCIIHLAAEPGVEKSLVTPAPSFNTNVLGTLTTLEFARRQQIKHFILASTCAVYSKKLNPYGASKLSAESYSTAYSDSYDIQVDIVRLGNVYGSWSENKTSVVAKFIKQALSGSPLTINGTGSQLRHFIYVDDVVGYIYDLISSNKRSTICNTHNVMNPYLTSIRAIAEEICDIAQVELGHDTGIDYIPMKPEMEPGINKVICTCSTKTGISSGLKKTFRWFKENYSVENQRLERTAS